MSSSRRLVDAALNRAREGLRVLEDLARFVQEDSVRVEQLKQMRHELTAISSAWPGEPLVLSRDTAGDVGTACSTEAERRRSDLRAVASAAGRRSTEALRSLEEVAKIDAPGLSHRIEQMRYELYDLAGGIEAGLICARASQWSLCVVLTEERCRLPWADVAAAAIEGGADCIQLREKSLETDELLRRASQLVAIARPRDVAVMINDRVDVALASGADGVHLGDHDMPAEEARAIGGSSLIIGRTVRTIQDVETARDSGANCFGIGPMFRTMTKPGLEPVGPERLIDLLPVMTGTPHLAIGGIDATNASTISRAGGKGVAVSGGVCDSADPAASASAIREALTGSTTLQARSSQVVPGHA